MPTTFWNICMFFFVYSIAVNKPKKGGSKNIKFFPIRHFQGTLNECLEHPIILCRYEKAGNWILFILSFSLVFSEPREIFIGCVT